MSGDQFLNRVMAIFIKTYIFVKVREEKGRGGKGRKEREEGKEGKGRKERGREGRKEGRKEGMEEGRTLHEKIMFVAGYL